MEFLSTPNEPRIANATITTAKALLTTTKALVTTVRALIRP